MASDLVLTLRSVKLVVETQLRGGKKRNDMSSVTAAYFTLLHLNKKVVLTHLLSFFNSANAADDDFVTSFKCHHFSNTVWGTRVVDISVEERK